MNLLSFQTKRTFYGNGCGNRHTGLNLPQSLGIRVRTGCLWIGRFRFPAVWIFNSPNYYLSIFQAHWSCHFSILPVFRYSTQCSRCCRGLFGTPPHNLDSLPAPSPRRNVLTYGTLTKATLCLCKPAPAEDRLYFHKRVFRIVISILKHSCLLAMRKEDTYCFWRIGWLLATFRGRATHWTFS